MKEKNYHIAGKKKISRNQKICVNERRHSHLTAYIYLFAFVFLGVLWGLNYAIKSYSPDINVSNNKTFSFDAPVSDTEVKSIDERLKWIQMEDDLPSVSIKSSEKAQKDKIETENKKAANAEAQSIPAERNEQPEQNEAEDAELPIPSISEIKLQKEDFRSIPIKEVIPLPKKPVTKVYLGNYSSPEAAYAVQNRLKKQFPELEPFVKQINGRYIVQTGSFYDGAKAGALAEKLQEKGYFPKINYEN